MFKSTNHRYHVRHRDQNFRLEAKARILSLRPRPGVRGQGQCYEVEAEANNSGLYASSVASKTSHICLFKSASVTRSLIMCW